MTVLAEIACKSRQAGHKLIMIEKEQNQKRIAADLCMEDAGRNCQLFNPRRQP
jgi:hypothetical protein